MVHRSPRMPNPRFDDLAFAVERKSKLPVPLIALDIAITVTNGLAQITMTRCYENRENVPLEAVATFPVAFEAALVGLEAFVDGRHLVAQARPSKQAREVYEDALERGKLAVLHEEKLRGVHVLSVAQLPPGQKVEIIATFIQPLAILDGVPVLRIPMTVGHIYGASPLLPVDDLVAGAGPGFAATFRIACADGSPVNSNGKAVGSKTCKIPLNRAIELSMSKAEFGMSAGFDAQGRKVEITLRPAPAGTGGINAAVLVDRSSSTADRLGKSGTVADAMRIGLDKALGSLGEPDRIALWEFDDTAELVGTARGAGAARLVPRIGGPRGGTQMGAAVQAAIKGGARDILVVTDGKTWASEVQAMASEGVRISGVLVGNDSLDAMIGHLVAMTGGQLFAAAGADVAPALASALQSMRTPGGMARQPLQPGQAEGFSIVRSGVEMDVRWHDGAGAEKADAVGRYAAALSLAGLDEAAATQRAVAHGLCTHLTSLVLVDEAGGSVEGVPELRKVVLEQPAFLRRSQAIAGNSRPMRLAQVANCAPSQPVSSPPASGGTKHRQAGRAGKNNNLLALAQSIDWTRIGPALSRGDLSKLSLWQRLRLWLFSRSKAVRTLAQAINKPPVQVAIALLAETVPDDNGTTGRIARAVLRDAPEGLLEKARNDLSDVLKV